MVAVQTFLSGLMSMDWYWQVWVCILGVFNMILPLVFIRRTEAQVVFAAFNGAFALMLILTAATGFTRILGLGHVVFWIPLLVYLAGRLREVPPGDAFGSWLRGVVAINAVSLAFDIVDVIRYIGGETVQIVRLG